MKKERTVVITLRVTEDTKNRLIKSAFLNFGKSEKFTTMNDFLNHIILSYLEQAYE